jgi:hypothetical protein
VLLSPLQARPHGDGANSNSAAKPPSEKTYSYGLGPLPSELSTQLASQSVGSPDLPHAIADVSQGHCPLATSP